MKQAALVVLLSLWPLVMGGFACLSNPCIHGVCLDDLNSTYSCYCIDGYTGVQCQTNWDECWSSPCRNGGTCIDGIAAYNCTCPAGYVGDDCEENFNECLSNPCLNNGTCVDALNGYECHCPAGFLGNHCEIDVAVCNSTNETRCSNGGMCVEGPGVTFTCQCPPGWTGLLCDLEVDECMSNPCQNGAVCIDLHAEYECACLFGFTGKNCEEVVLMCEDSPCRNDALCLMEDDRPVCYCVPDFHGDKCQLQYDECQLGPNRCLNGGTCIDGIDGYTCSCPPQLTGSSCECLIIDDQFLDCSNNFTSLPPIPTPTETNVPITASTIWETTTEPLIFSTQVSTTTTPGTTTISLSSETTTFLTTLIESTTLPTTETTTEFLTTSEETTTWLLTSTTTEFASSSTENVPSTTLLETTEMPSTTSTEKIFLETSTTESTTFETSTVEFTIGSTQITEESTLKSTLPEITTTEMIFFTSEPTTLIMSTETEGISETTPIETTEFIRQNISTTVIAETTTEYFQETTTDLEEVTTTEIKIVTDCTQKDHRCQNGGSCIFNEEENISKCVCPFDFAGPKCETNLGIKSAAFGGDSYLAHKLYSKDSIQLSFRAKTKTNAGLLFYAYLGHTYMALFMENGSLRFKFSCGLQTMLLSEVNKSINDGNYMKIDAGLRFSNDFKTCNASIRLNDTLSMSGYQMALWDPFKNPSWVYLGGTRNRMDAKGHLQGIPGFIGCMTQLVISEKPVEIFKDAVDGYRISECSSLACLSNPCQNGGVCETNKRDNSWTCSCKNGYWGDSCEKSACDNNPCEFGATCLPYTGSGYICLCPFGKHGHFCENDLRISKVYYSASVQGYASYTAYTIPKGSFNSMEIKFRFTPTTLHQISLLMFVGQEGQHDHYSDHMAVSFVEGFLLLTWNLGSGPRRIFIEKSLPADKASYQVHIGREGRRSWMFVEHLGNVTGRSPGSLSHLDVEPVIYFGGHKSKGFRTLPHDLPLHSGFSGCIYDIELKTGDVIIPLETNSAVVSGRSVGQCGTTECHEGVCQNGGACLYHGGTFTCLCQDGFFGPLCSSAYNLCDRHRNPCHGNAICVTKLADYVCDCPLGFKGLRCSINETLNDISFTGTRSFLTLREETFQMNRLNLELELRPLKTDGLILLIGFESFISMSLVSGLLEIRISTKHKRELFSDILLIRSNKLVVLGQWHKIIVQIHGRKVYLFVDNVVNTGVLPLGDIFDLGTQSIHLGGLKDLSLLPNGATTELPTRFKGCIRHFSINNRQKELIDNALEGRNLEECDGSPCDGNYCLNGGTCWLDPDLQAHCACPKGYAGFRCQEEPHCSSDNQCTNNGYCSHGRCVCRVGFAGVYCEVSITIKVPKFTGTTYLLVSGNMSNEIARFQSLKLRKKDAVYNSAPITNLKLIFSTASEGLLLLIIRKTDKTALLALGVSPNGHLKLTQFQKTDSQKDYIKWNEIRNLNDGFNHILDVFLNTSTIVIDSHKISVELELLVDFYIGGLPEFTDENLYADVRKEFPMNFEGCIQIKHAGLESIQSGNYLDGRNVLECSN